MSWVIHGMFFIILSFFISQCQCSPSKEAAVSCSADCKVPYSCRSGKCFIPCSTNSHCSAFNMICALDEGACKASDTCIPQATEICTDGKDNNCDSFVDSLDPLCRSQTSDDGNSDSGDNNEDDNNNGGDNTCLPKEPPACGEFGVCAEAKKKCNGELYTDCNFDDIPDYRDPEGPNCSNDSGIPCCADNKDNDCDNLTDCKDPDCTEYPGCCISDEGCESVGVSCSDDVTIRECSLKPDSDCFSKKDTACPEGQFCAKGECVEICTTSWQKHIGMSPNDAIISFNEYLGQNNSKVFDFSDIPPEEDNGWTIANDNIDFDDPSILTALGAESVCGSASEGAEPHCQTNKCRCYGDFTYFQTFIMIPEGFNPQKLKFNMDAVDDQAQISIFNTKYPNGSDPKGYIAQGGSAVEIELSNEMTEGKNRFVITHVDDCCKIRALLGVSLKLNGHKISKCTQ